MGFSWKRDLSRGNGDLVIFKNTAYLGVSRIITSLIPTGIFIILGRKLGSQGVGVVFGILSLIFLMQPFVDIGYSQIVLREISRKKEMAQILISKAIGFVIITSSFFAAIIFSLGIFIGFPPVPLVFLIVGYVFIRSVHKVWVMAFQAIERMEYLSIFEIFDNVIRLVGVLLLWWMDKVTVSSVAFIYLFSNVMLLVFSFTIGIRHFGSVTVRPQIISKKEIVESSHFALNSLGNNIFLQMDKVMLSKLSTMSGVGIYTFAQKVYSVFINLQSAFLMSAYPRFFKKGKIDHPRKYKEFSVRISFLITVFGVLSGGIVFFTAPLIVKLVGSSFNESVLILRIFAFYPLLRGLATVLGNILTGSDNQKIRMYITWIGAGVNIILNYILIAFHGGAGAAVATLISYGVMVLIELAAIKIKGIFRYEN